MESLYPFAISLLSAGAPWMAGIIVVAVALNRLLPIRLNLSIGDYSNRSAQQKARPRPVSARTLADNTARPRLPE